MTAADHAEGLRPPDLLRERPGARDHNDHGGAVREHPPQPPGHLDGALDHGMGPYRLGGGEVGVLRGRRAHRVREQAAIREDGHRVDVV